MYMVCQRQILWLETPSVRKQLENRTDWHTGSSPVHLQPWDAGVPWVRIPDNRCEVRSELIHLATEATMFSTHINSHVWVTLPRQKVKRPLCFLTCQRAGERERGSPSHLCAISFNQKLNSFVCFATWAITGSDSALWLVKCWSPFSSVIASSRMFH